MRPVALALACLLLAPPAGAQQYWLPNGPGGTTFNNPQGSLLGTMNEHLLQRHMQQRQMERGAAPQRGATRAAVPGAPHGTDPSFQVSNGGSRIVRELYVSAATDRSWGVDRLGAEVLRPGQRMAIRLPSGQCINDIRIVFMDGEAQERRQVDTCLLGDVLVR